MINRQLSRLLLCSILGSTTLISGCALVRKDSAPHQQLKPEQIKLADDIHLASSGWPQAQWWKQLNDPQLDALIQRTLSGSHTLAEAKLRERKSAVPGRFVRCRFTITGRSVRDAQPPTCLGERLFKPLFNGCASTGYGRAVLYGSHSRFVCRTGS